MTKKARSTSELRRVDRELSKLAGRLYTAPSPVARREIVRKADVWLEQRLRAMRG